MTVTKKDDNTYTIILNGQEFSLGKEIKPSTYTTKYTDNTGVKVSAPFRIDNYKNIRQYIHNYLGITKDEIREMFRDELKQVAKEELRKVLNDKEYIERLTREELLHELKSKFNEEHRAFYVSVCDSIYNKVQETIHQEVLKRLVIDLKEPDE